MKVSLDIYHDLPRRYGGPGPRVGGSVVLSLYRMNQVLEVNEKAAYAVVEPGVTFFDLYEYCRARKLAVWPSVPAIAWGSVVGNVSSHDCALFLFCLTDMVDPRSWIWIYLPWRPSEPYLWDGGDTPRW